MSPIPDHIRWLEEMLVTPQHLRQVALRFEALIQALPGHYHPYFWGVTHCESALDAGVLAVRALDAVLPNGAQVVIDDERQQLKLDLRPFAALLRKTPILVHLAMPLGSAQDSNGSRRFVACEREAADVIVGEDGVEIQRVPTGLVLLAGETPAAARSTSFPLLEVRSEGPSYVVTDFMPPTLRVTPTSPLGHRCASIPERLRREAAVVADRGTDSPQLPFTADVRGQLHPIVAALPAFEVLLPAAPHAFALYAELCRLAGAVAVMRNRVVPPKCPEYVHNDARAAFDHVVQFVLGAADDIASDAVRRFTFEREGTWLRLPLDPGWTDALDLGSRFRMILAMQAATADAQAEKWGDNCVIATRSAVRSLLSRRILGLARRRVAPGAGLPSQRDLYLFEITPDPDAARSGEDLLVLGDLPGLTPSALHLYVVERIVDGEQARRDD